MAFNTQEQDIIQYGLQNGKSRLEVETALFNFRNGILPKKSQFTEPTFIESIVSDAETRADRVGGILSRSDSSIAEKGLQIFGQGAGLAAGTIEKTAELIPGVKQAFQAFGTGVNWLATSDYSPIKHLGEVIGGNKTLQEVTNLYDTDQNFKDSVDAVANIARLGGDVQMAKGAVNFTKNVTQKIATKIQTTLPPDGGAGAFSKVFEKITPQSSSMMNRVARLKPTDFNKFKAVSGKTPGEYLVETGNFGPPDKIIANEATKFTQSMNAVDNELAKLPGVYKDGAVVDALNGLLEKAKATSGGNVYSPYLGKIRGWIMKYKEGGLTMAEINQVKRLYESKVKLGYNKLLNAEKVEMATNIDAALRKWQFEQARKLGFKNIDAMNKQTQISKFLVNKLGDQVVGKVGLNGINLTDWVMLSGGDSSSIAGFLTKKFFSSNTVQAKVAELLNRAGIKPPVTPDVGLTRENIARRISPQGQGALPVGETVVPTIGSGPVINLPEKMPPLIEPMTPNDSRLLQPQSLGKVIESPSGNPTTKTSVRQPNVLEKANTFLKGKVGLTAQDVTKSSLGEQIKAIGVQKPTIKLKRDVTVTTLSGEKVKIPEDEVLKAYESGGKALLKDGREYIVSKSQYENIKNNSLKSEAKDFAPELKGTEEIVKGTEKMAIRDKAYADFDAGKITREQRNAIIDKLGVPNETKYSQYQLPKGKNYKEILIKAPSKDTRVAVGEMEGGAKIYHEENTADFKSSHWDEPNVISHLRLNERTYQGKKVTFMEEMQSDWAREARKSGNLRPAEYVIEKTDDGRYRVFDPAFPNNMTDRMSLGQAKEMKKTLEANKDMTGVPNNPLLKNWQELSVKRALKEAVDNNSEYLAWTTGEQQAARYNLSQEIKSINWENQIAGRKGIKIQPKSGETFGIVVNEKGVITDSVSKTEWEGKQLDSVIGKGISEKILAEPKGNLSGEGLNIGGEWAKNLYDKQVKNIVEDLTGGKVEVIDLGLPIDTKTKAITYLKNRENVPLTKEAATVGKQITVDNSEYIITDILGDGKFKAVPVSEISSYLDNGQTPAQYLDYKAMEKRMVQKNSEGQREWIDKQIETRKKFIERNSETFDISTKKSIGQQAIRLTPEIKALVNSKAPKLK